MGDGVMGMFLMAFFYCEAGFVKVWEKLQVTQLETLKRQNYFTSSDPHHDISKQPR